MTSASNLYSLPLFPLGTTLFPGGLLPLRIFEVRYLDMVRKCHEAGAPFGVVTLQQGSEVRQPGVTETFASVGTLAAIDALDAVQAGLLNIRCSGSQRFRVLRTEQLKHGLWIADVQRIADDAVVALPEDLQPAAQALQRVLATLEQRGMAAPLAAAAPRLDDCGWVANRWCELLPLTPTIKQQLLELDSPLLRLELVADFLARHNILVPPEPST